MPDHRHDLRSARGPLTTTDVRRPSPARRWAAAALASVLTLSVVAAIEWTHAPAAAAVTPPITGISSEHVTADPLPTVQIDGVVWDQEIIGNTTYVVGSFAEARPAGSPLGQNETPRANVLAYDLTTGALIQSFVANTNAQVRTITVSPDRSRLYIGGQFTQVNGVNRYRIAALNPTTGAVITSFSAITDYIVHDLVATSDTLYAGGAFNYAGSGNAFTRTKLAAFSTTNGAVTGWAPTADANVRTLVMGPDGSRLFVGGHFLKLNGQSAFGMGALNPVDGSLIPWAANQVIRNGGSFSGAILHLFTDGTSIYGNGFTSGRAAGNLEGAFKAHPETGAIQWIEDCHGDTYQSTVMNGYVYAASHAHFCGNLGGFPQTDEVHSAWDEYKRHSLSFTVPATGVLRRDNWSYHNFEGRPAPSLTAWYPEWQTGTYTGQGQAVWAVEGNGQYLSYAGEFTRVNTLDQQGIVRFAVRSIAPHDQGPRLGGDGFPIKVRSPSAGRVLVSFPANWDRDDHDLTYTLFRNGAAVQTTTAASTFWDRPTVTFSEIDLLPGQTYDYRVRVADPWGNAAISSYVDVTVSTTDLPSTYAEQVVRDDARIYWRLGDAPGSATARDTAAFQTGTVNNMTFGRQGAIAGDPDTAVRPVDGTSRIVQPPLINRQGQPERNPTVDEFSVEAWFRSTGTKGGRLIGFGNSNSGDSGSTTSDRMLYVSNNGALLFGVRTRPEGTGATGTRENRTISSAPGLNDGDWHHVVGTLSSNGMRLYVDGNQVASRTDVNSGTGYYGYWRVGPDVIGSSWTSAPSTTVLDGDIDEAAVYFRALTTQQVTNHWNLSGHGNAAPTAAFTSSTTNLSASFDASGSSDSDGTIVSYEWNFGDGSTGAGVTTSHTYAAAGTYTVTLTVRDDDGATGTANRQVTATAPGVLATDAFGRTASNGWGTADFGGPWSISGGSNNFSVSGGQGRYLSAAGAGMSSFLNQVSGGDVLATVDVGSSAAPAGGPMWVSLAVRRVGTSDYRVKVRVSATSSTIYLVRVINNAETTLASATVNGLVYQPGDTWRVKLRATGSGTTTVQAKFWNVATAEPAAWQVSTTDTTAALQSPGGVGVVSFLASSVTNAPLTVLWDNLNVTAA